MRNEAFCSLPGGHSAVMSCTDLGLNDAANHWRASRSRGSRRISYNCRISFTSSNVGRAMPLLIEGLILHFLAGPHPRSVMPSHATARRGRVLAWPQALLFLDDPDAGHCIAFLQRRHRTNERDDPSLRRHDLFERTIEVVGHRSDLRAFG